MNYPEMELSIVVLIWTLSYARTIFTKLRMSHLPHVRLILFRCHVL